MCHQSDTLKKYICVVEKQNRFFCRYLKPLGKNINLMIWCLCNHQSDLNYDKMVALLRDSIMQKSSVKITLIKHASKITTRELIPRRPQETLEKQNPVTLFKYVLLIDCNFAFVNMACVVPKDTSIYFLFCRL